MIREINLYHVPWLLGSMVIFLYFAGTASTDKFSEHNNSSSEQISVSIDDINFDMTILMLKNLTNQIIDEPWTGTGTYGYSSHQVYVLERCIHIIPELKYNQILGDLLQMIYTIKHHQDKITYFQRTIREYKHNIQKNSSEQIHVSINDIRFDITITMLKNLTDMIMNEYLQKTNTTPCQNYVAQRVIDIVPEFKHSKIFVDLFELIYNIKYHENEIPRFQDSIRSYRQKMIRDKKRPMYNWILK